MSAKNEFVRGEGSIEKNNKIAHEIRRRTERQRIGIDGRATVVGSLLATTALTIAANMYTSENSDDDPVPTT